MGDAKTQRRYGKLTPEVQAEFLRHLAESGLMYASAQAAGISHAAIMSRQAKDRDFAEAIEEAKGEFTDTIIKEIHRRGVEGVEKPVFHKGERCDNGEVLEFSDRLLELLVKRMDPSFRDHVKVEGNIAAGVLVVEAGTKTTAEWIERHNGKPDEPEEENLDEISRE